VCIPATWCARLTVWPPLRSLSLHLRTDSSIKTKPHTFMLSHTAAAVPAAASAAERACAHAVANPALSRHALTPLRMPILLHASTTIKGLTPCILSAPIAILLSAPVSHSRAPLCFSTMATMASSPDGPSLLMRRSQWSPWAVSSLRTGRPRCCSTGATAPRHHADDHPPSSVSHRSTGARLPSSVMACS
jgi:hypothetical protein